MSHEITKIDRQQGIEMGWHGLTEVLPQIELKTSFLSLWDIEKSPLLRPDGTASDYCELVCTDNRAIRIDSVPVHCETYVPITNAEFLSVIENALVGIKGATVASVGSVCGRGRIFVSIRLAALASFEAAGREFKPFLNFLSSHDQSCMFTLNTSNICTVCNNTFTANLAATVSNSKNQGEELAMRAKHTKNVKLKLDNVAGLVDKFLGAQAEFQSILNVLGDVKVSRDEGKAFFAGFLAAPGEIKAARAGKNPEISTRRGNQVERLNELFISGPGNRGETAADLFSSVTDYYTHESSGERADIEKQLVSSEYGAGATAKTRAFNILKDGDQFGKVIDAGKAILVFN